MEQMLSLLLDGAVETLDIAPELQQIAIERYDEVGSWLAEHGGYQCNVYPQGSFRLGTVVRPATVTGEYDIDLVCLLMIAKEHTTQADLKKHVGELLQEFMSWKNQQGHTDGPSGCEPSRRCWTLEYAGHGFHLDVLPTIPDTEYPPTGLLLTDKQLYYWQRSNPIGYADWFRTQSEELQTRLIEKAQERHSNVADVPTWTVRTTLQRVVQVLKWHSMLYFADDPDNRPPSILVTTLAARAYQQESDLFTATRGVLVGMRELIEKKRDDKWWVTNPAHEKENFADKWNDYPARRTAFLEWHGELTGVLDNLLQLQGEGVPAVTSYLAKSFGKDAIDLSARRYSDRLRFGRETDTLRMTRTGQLTTSTTTSGKQVRPHTFHGQHPDARG